MSDEDYGAEFALAHGSKVVDGKVKHEDTAVVWFYSRPSRSGRRCVSSRSTGTSSMSSPSSPVG